MDDFHYNISHTRSAFVVGVSKETIGVDVEKIRDCEMGIAERFFVPEEVQYIRKVDEDVSKRFYGIWTKKEAYIKWVGKGLSIPLDSFCVVDSEISDILRLNQFNDYLVSVCSNELSSTKIIDFKETNLYNLACDYTNKRI